MVVVITIIVLLNIVILPLFGQRRFHHLPCSRRVLTVVGRTGGLIF